MDYVVFAVIVFAIIGGAFYWVKRRKTTNDARIAELQRRIVRNRVSPDRDVRIAEIDNFVRRQIVASNRVSTERKPVSRPAAKKSKPSTSSRSNFYSDDDNSYATWNAIGYTDNSGGSSSTYSSDSSSGYSSSSSDSGYSSSSSCD